MDGGIVFENDAMRDFIHRRENRAAGNNPDLIFR